MSFFEALILGLIQGLTEFLPVSSDGHLELAKAVFGGHTGSSLTYDLLLHLGTVMSILVVFRKDLASLLKNGLVWPASSDTRYLGLIFLSAIPAGLIGVGLKHQIEALFGGHLQIAGGGLLVTGLILCTTVFARGGNRQVGWKDALLIGLGQAAGLLPGVSRSGSTIAVALLLGIDRTEAARFSFLMVIMPILGACLLEMKDLSGSDLQLPFWPVAVGIAVSFVVGVAACKTMIAVVRRSNLLWFAAYCFLVGGLAVLWPWLPVPQP